MNVRVIVDSSSSVVDSSLSFSGHFIVIVAVVIIGLINSAVDCIIGCADEVVVSFERLLSKVNSDDASVVCGFDSEVILLKLSAVVWPTMSPFDCAVDTALVSDAVVIGECAGQRAHVVLRHSHRFTPSSQ